MFGVKCTSSHDNTSPRASNTKQEKYRYVTLTDLDFEPPQIRHIHHRNELNLSGNGKITWYPGYRIRGGTAYKFPKGVVTWVTAGEVLSLQVLLLGLSAVLLSSLICPIPVMDGKCFVMDLKCRNGYVGKFWNIVMMEYKGSCTFNVNIN